MEENVMADENQGKMQTMVLTCQDDVQFIFLYVFSVLLLLYSVLPF